MDKVYNVGEIRKLIAESSNEFKPVIGKNVESDNKKNNGKANKESMDKVKKYDNGLKDEKDWARGDAKYEKTDGNHTTLGHNPENASPEYKKRVKANALGYSSEQEMKNGYENSGDFSDNEDIFNAITKNEKEMDDNVKDFKKTGLQAREMDDETFEKDTLYESKDGFDMRKMINNLSEHMSNIAAEIKTTDKPLKTIYYKKTEFINEQHMLSKVPDEFKVNGTKVKMKDKTGNEYIVEWQNNTGKVINHTNKAGWGESIDKMKRLFEYTSPESQLSHSSRVNESDKMFSKTLNAVRKPQQK